VSSFCVTFLTFVFDADFVKLNDFFENYDISNSKFVPAVSELLHFVYQG